MAGEIWKSTHGSFTDGENNKIEWRFISQLHDVQKEVGLKFGNKLSAKHIEYTRNKMNVNEQNEAS